MTVTEQEVTQYDRQIRLWGLEAQNRLRSSKILLFGLKPLGAEICKNLVLAGIGEISVCDSEPINEKVKRIHWFAKNWDTIFCLKLGLSRFRQTGLFQIYRFIGESQIVMDIMSGFCQHTRIL